jgi:hypothetical protein
MALAPSSSGVAIEQLTRMRARGGSPVDGSLVPGAAAATNPSRLISALTERCLDRIVTRIEHGLPEHE